MSNHVTDFPQWAINRLRQVYDYDCLTGLNCHFDALLKRVILKKGYVIKAMLFEDKFIAMPHCSDQLKATLEVIYK